MSVGELFDGTIETAAAPDRPIDTSSSTGSCSGRPWTAAAVGVGRRDAAKRRSATDRWPTVVLSNHDQPRHASRLAASVGSDGDRDAIARAAAVLLLTMRGTPFLYYGEEIGMRRRRRPARGERRSAGTRTSGPDFHWWDRSRCRTPMPWTRGPGAGFTTGRPWLRLGPDVATRNVRDAAARPRVGPVVLSPADRPPCGDAGPPGRGASHRRTASDVGRRRVHPRSRAGQVALVALNIGRDRRHRGACRTRAGHGGWRALLSTAATEPPTERLAAGSTHRPGRRTRPSSSRGSTDQHERRPCYHDGRSIQTHAGETTCRSIS